MKTLLMAIDNSPVAAKVIELATEQALAQQAQVLVLCCIDPAYTSCHQTIEIDAGEDAADFIAAEDEQNTAELVVRRALAPLLQSGVIARGMILPGEAAETIISQAKKIDASMIIMGRRHLSPFNRLLKGSVSAAVIERADCPVLIDTRKDC
ncbi:MULTISPECIES: universal stress protein [Pantoea]|jgi:Universal stress protein UspA and related nucleotide-binding proteins|uniref:Universal stress protein n=1 Tax=Candidatus Pantoea multigeneris TaxID=2608357 RepID=A0ABX0R669_9GAMM|nr:MULTISPECIES: universal stress protein [Pantoea]NIF20896.1 universal stress protein [Pantoea multigeneris]